MAVVRRMAMTVERNGRYILRRISNRKAKRYDLRLDINLYGGQPHLGGYRPKA